VDQLKRTHPSLKVLYTTGYTRNAIVHNGTLDFGTELLTKPYTIDELAEKIRKVLDRK
ncbi:MAG: hybrid sensor histidine kinase/response regulator, partial [Mesorhizobium sp.]